LLFTPFYVYILQSVEEKSGSVFILRCSPIETVWIKHR